MLHHESVYLLNTLAQKLRESDEMGGRDSRDRTLKSIEVRDQDLIMTMKPSDLLLDLRAGEATELGYLVSASVLRALAIEILLKALIYKKDGSLQEPGDLMKLSKKLGDLHNLKFLFDKLIEVSDAQTRKQIKDLETQYEMDLGQTLEKHKQDFIGWRYVYEAESRSSEISNLEKVLKILHTLIWYEREQDRSGVSSP